MAKDLTIRELNRPQISQDNQLGFQKIVRKYVVEGDRVNQAELNSPADPLFLPVGDTDTEYTDHYLVNQQIAPATGDMDRAYLTREFIQLRNQFFSESTNQSHDLIRLNRKYAVLRSDDAVHGYGSNWGKHPNNSESTSYSSEYTPWDYAPGKVSEPNAITYNYSNDSGFTSIPQVSINGGQQSLFDYLTSNVGNSDMGKWLPGRASVSQYMPGLDIWDVEWITHGAPYWTVGTAKGSGSKSTPLTVIDFDHNGLIIDDFGSSGGSDQSKVIARTKNFFHVGESLPDSLVSISGGSDSSYAPNTVHVDIQMLTRDRQQISETKVFKNAVFKVTGTGASTGLRFPIQPGGSLQQTVATRESKRRLVFNFTEDPGNPFSYCVYKGQYIARIGGAISWTRSHLVTTGSTGSTTRINSSTSKITPIFSYSNNGTAKRIWKIEITYIG
jgi:hypothetical protein